jgi:hypothetical protein
MSKFNKLGFKAMIRAVLDMDDETLGGLDGVETLFLNCPEQGELDTAKEYLTDMDARFAKGEEYCVELLRSGPSFHLSRYIGRLRVSDFSVGTVDGSVSVVCACQGLKFKATYQEDVDYLNANIGIVYGACCEVLLNKNLKEFLVDIILSFGG